MARPVKKKGKSCRGKTLSDLTGVPPDEIRERTRCWDCPDKGDERQAAATVAQTIGPGIKTLRQKARTSQGT